MSSSVSKRIHPNKTCTASTHRHRWMHRHDNRTTLALYLVLGFWGFSSDSDWLGVDRRFPPLIAITSVKNNLQIGPINHSHDNHHVASSPFCTSRHGLNHHARCGDLVRGCFGTCTGVLLFRCGRVTSRILSRVTFGGSFFPHLRVDSCIHAKCSKYVSNCSFPGGWLQVLCACFCISRNETLGFHR